MEIKPSIFIIPETLNNPGFFNPHTEDHQYSRIITYQNVYELVDKFHQFGNCSLFVVFESINSPIIDQLNCYSDLPYYYCNFCDTNIQPIYETLRQPDTEVLEPWLTEESIEFIHPSKSYVKAYGEALNKFIDSQPSLFREHYLPKKLEDSSLDEIRTHWEKLATIRRKMSVPDDAESVFEKLRQWSEEGESYVYAPVNNNQFDLINQKFANERREAVRFTLSDEEDPFKGNWHPTALKKQSAKSNDYACTIKSTSASDISLDVQLLIDDNDIEIKEPVPAYHQAKITFNLYAERIDSVIVKTSASDLSKVTIYMYTEQSEETESHPSGFQFLPDLLPATMAKSLNNLLDHLNEPASFAKYLRLGITEHSNDELSQAFEHYQKALDICSHLDIDDRRELASAQALIHANLGNFYLENGDFDVAVDHYQTTFDIYNTLENKPEFLLDAKVLTNLGIVLYYNDNDDDNLARAIECYKQALDIYYRMDSDTPEFIQEKKQVQLNLGLALRQNNKLTAIT